MIFFVGKMPMSKRHLRVVHAALLLLALPFAGHAADTNCPALFQGGQAPDLIDTSLSERTTTICYDAYSMDASGVTKGPLWSAEHLTAEQIADAGNISRNAFGDLGMPSVVIMALDAKGATYSCAGARRRG